MSWGYGLMFNTYVSTISKAFIQALSGSVGLQHIPTVEFGDQLKVKLQYVPLEVRLIQGLVQSALHVRQLLLHFVISGGVFDVHRED